MTTPAVVLGAMTACSFGVAPVPLVTTTNVTVMAGGRPMAVITDAAPLSNLASFGVCSSPANPAVIAATAAALGVFTPAPCVPVTIPPWSPGKPMILAGNLPIVTLPATCQCSWGGVVTVTQPGQMTVLG